MFHYLKVVILLARPLPTLSILIISLTGSIIATSSKLNLTEITVSLVGIACIAIAGYIWNDICDIRTDAKNYPSRPIPSGAISQAEAIAITVIFVLIGGICALLLSTAHSGMALTMVVVLIIYSPYLKKLPLLGNLTVAALFTLAFYWGVLSVRGDWRSVAWIAAFLFTFSLTREMIETVADIDGDRLAGYQTLPVIAPEWVTYGVIFITYILTIILSLLDWDQRGVIYLISTFITAGGLMVILVVASLNQNPPQLRLLSKFMNLCLLIWLIGLILSNT